MESFVWDEDQASIRPLGSDEVEIVIKAVGVNIRDVAIAMGTVSDNYLGNECAGQMSQISPLVTVLPHGAWDAFQRA